MMSAGSKPREAWFPLGKNEEFTKSTVPAPPSGCVLWLSAVNDTGYGVFNFRSGGRKRSALAHRMAWALEHGFVPEGSCVLHRCDVPSCVNPAHLFLGSMLDNVRDMVAKGRHGNTKKECCKRGHPFDEKNTRTSKSGVRRCRRCGNEQARRWWADHRRQS